ncbi:MFS transporter [Dactylosporangium siamense]|uniref:Major facilitator superfamily (MFS) profile domain-containing protein n=1 Tax=Dactylosporangium siamense TaxID=685454 RepID=A0A919PYD1_9ACTN|nr:MFS transporter [Dactylosporangium siamense]GIG50793.1 hypothetical protein Dsi01nite_088340 [Dactylosporangium siamense]
MTRTSWRLWSATALSSAGEGTYVTAMPLLAAAVAGDPRLVSLVAAAAYLPWLLVSVPAGALTDRLDRTTLMWRAQLAQVVVVGLFLAGGPAGVPVLVVTAFALGSCAVVSSTAAQAVLPELVARPLLHRANGHQQTAIVAGQLFIGPPLGGLLFALATWWPFVAYATALALSAGLLATLPTRAAVRNSRSSTWDGVRWLARHRFLRTLAVLVSVNLCCGQLANTVLVLLATRTLHVGARGYGLLLAAAAVGGVAGGLAAGRLAGRVGAIPALIGALAVNAAAILGAGASHTVPLLGVCLAVNGLATTTWNVVTVGLRQELVPADLLGRVIGVTRMLGWGLVPAGTVLGGLIAHRYGLRAPFLVAGTVRAVAVALAVPALLHYRRAL